MRKVLLFFLLCMVLGCNFHFVKSERYGLANERDMSDENDGLNMEDYYEDYGDDDVDVETENDARPTKIPTYENLKAWIAELE